MNEAALSLVAIAAIPWFVLALDAADALVRLFVCWRKRRARAAFARHVLDDSPAWRRGAGIAPHAFVATVRDLGADVDAFISRRAPLRDVTWLVDLGSSDHTMLRLRAAGWRCIDFAQARDERGALAQLVANLPKEVATVMLLDHGTEPASAIDEPDRFLRVLREFQQGGAAAAGVRVEFPTNGLGAWLRQAEATIAFGIESRSLDPAAMLTEGAFYRRDVLHSLLERREAVRAGRFVDSLALLARGERVVCEPRIAVVSRESPSFGAWLASAAGDWLGELTAIWTRRRELAVLAGRGPLAFYHFALYLGLLRLACVPLRFAASILLLASLSAACLLLAGAPATFADPLSFALVYPGYLLIHVAMALVAAPRRARIAALAAAPLGIVLVIARGLLPLAAPFAARGVDPRGSVGAEVAHVAR